MIDGRTGQSEVGTLNRVAMKHARDAFIDQQSIDAQWERLGYTARPHFKKAVAEYDAFVEILHGLGVQTVFLPPAPPLTLDSVYVRDASVVCNGGLILCQMGKEARAGESEAQGREAPAWGMPVVGKIGGTGRLEGGDVVWLGERILAVGRGYRTNDEGLLQLKKLLRDWVDDLIVVPLPHFRGPGDVFHLMSILSPLDTDLALVYSPLMPIPFRETLIALGYDLVEVPEHEFDSMGPNVLAVGPRRCLMLAGSPETKARMESRGVEVSVYEGDEISRKGCGGPTCLTRPLERHQT